MRGYRAAPYGTDNSSRNRGQEIRFWILLTLVVAAATLLTYAGGFGSGVFQPAQQVANNAAPPQMMGLNLNSEIVKPGSVPWPTFPFGSYTLWGTGNTWPALNTAEGVYDWSNLDAWLSKSEAEGMTDIIYSFGKTPTWASSKPNDQSCVNAASPPGSCDPPDDVNPDGTGTDQHVKDFFTALVAHVGSQVKYYEMWNEPDDVKQWTGTNAQLVRMSSDAYAIIKSMQPNALVTTPSPAGGLLNEGPDWMGPYLAAGGLPYADVLTFHGYINMLAYSPPEDEIPIIVAYKHLLASYSSKIPMWDTQAGWNRDSNLPDPNMQAAYLARLYILSKANGVARFYWYQYGNSEFGTIWTSTGGLNLAGTAYGQIYNWLVGTIESAPCKEKGTVYTCGFQGRNGLLEQPVWDTAQTCSNGVCTTSTFTPSTIYINYMDLEGNKTPISPPGSPIQIGAEPILLINQ
jgi:polysaccharide biosynthesis protein PslG